MNKYRIIFAGTPDFAVPSLEALIGNKALEILAIISQPDKPVGRGLKLTPTPTKIIGNRHHIKVLQPDKINEIKTELEDLKPDLMVVIAYGQILSEDILAIPKYGCLNVHGSLLPKYRGSACITQAIINDDKETGITFMQMDKGMDSGPILKQCKTKLIEQETATSLNQKLAELSAEHINDIVINYLNGKIKAQDQQHDQATFAYRLKKAHGHLDFSQSAKVIERKIRALNPWPGTYGFGGLPEKPILFKILAVRPNPITTDNYQPGELFIHDSALAIKCADQALIITKLQMEGKKAMEADEFLRGNNNNVIGKILT